MKSMLKKGLLAVALLAASMGVCAEDIDLFVGVEPTTNTDYPNVIILLDNSANWAAQNQHWPGGIQQGQAELTAIKTVINSLAPEGTDAKVNVGLMMLNDANGQTPDGGYVRSALKQMTVANRTAFSNLVDSIYPNVTDPSEKVAASVGYDRAMFEVFKYFGGYTSPANAYKDVAGSPVDSTHFGPRRYSGDATYGKRDATAFDPDSRQTTYIPAAPTITTCKSKNYVIMIGNGWPAPTETDAATLLQNVGGDTTQIYETTSAKVRYADEMARFLYQTDVSAATGKQNVITYTIDVYHDQQDLDHTKLLKSMAHVGGGTYFSATSASEITAALGKIFSEIQSVNSVFASVSLPVSVNTQGTYLNQVFVGMFRPDQNALPRWAGNLKQYKLGLVNTSELQLQDADDAAAINRLTGFITGCARSFWTPSASASSVSLPGYWNNVAANAQTAGTCDDYNKLGYTYAEYPDGSIVEKGAQSYRLRRLSSSAARTVKTCSTAACTALANFNNTTVSSPSALGSTVTTNADRDALIDWGRGADNAANSEFTTDPRPATTTIRPSVHGDVVHSRPVAINFGDDTNKKVVVFYGSNDGLLRAVNGNRDGGLSIGTDDQPGDELWSFMAPEFYQKIQRIRDNSVKVNFKDRTVLAGETVAPKPYGVDGSITAYQSTSASWLYATLRRGGRALYAFDVTTPQTPSLKWRIGCNSDGSSCSTGFDQLGQTWSSVKPFKAAGYGSGASPLLIMGGGYDICEDTDNGSQNHSCGDTPLGNQIYILDANSGTQVASFQTKRSVVGDVTIVPDSTGKAKYAYAADTGGNVYRITFGTATQTDGSVRMTAGMTRIATVGCAADGNSTCDINRKFLFAPDVVSYDDTYYVLLGSGDREKPLTSFVAATTVDNYFFVIKDKPTDSTWLTSESTNCAGRERICMNSLLPITGTSTPSDADLGNKKGWYLALSDNEQVVTSAITVYGVVTFSTHIPATYSPGQCSSLGTARVYNINYTNAASANGTGLRYEQISGGGLPPSPVAGMVTLDNGKTVPFVIGSDADSPLQGGAPSGGADTVQPKAKVYWNIEQ